MSGPTDEQLAEWEKLARRNVVMGINRYADDAILLLVRALRDARDEARNHELCNGGCVPGDAYRDLAHHHAEAERENAALRERLAAVERPSAGRCGAASPMVLPGSTVYRCDLRAGHLGWHGSGNGTEWSASLPAEQEHEDVEVTEYGDLAQRRRVWTCVNCGQTRHEPIPDCSGEQHA